MKIGNCKRVLICFLAFLLCTFSIPVSVKATNDDTLLDQEGAPKIKVTKKMETYTAAPGQEIEIVVPVRAINHYLANPYISPILTDLPLELVSDVTMGKDNVTNEVTGIDYQNTTNIYFTLRVSDTAKKGTYKVYLNVTGYYAGNSTYDIKTNVPVEIKVQGEKKEATISISGVTTQQIVKPEEEFELDFDVTNIGELTASNVSVSLEGFTSDGILPTYSVETTKIGTLTGGKSYHIKMYLKCAKGATNGAKTITIKTTYKDSQGNEKTDSNNIYVEVEGSGEENKSNMPDLLIKDVTQEPSNPIYGGNLTLRFTLQNKGDVAATDIKITPTNLTNTNFTPTSSNPYIYIKKLKAGAEKEIVMYFTVAKKVEEGLNEIVLSTTYRNHKGVAAETPMENKFFIRNVVAKEEEKEEKEKMPDLLIKNVVQEPERPVYGGNLKLSFTLYNKGDVGAKDIKITPTNLTNTNFTPTSSNPYIYIGGMAAGEEQRIVMNFTVSKKVEDGLNEVVLSTSYTNEKGTAPEAAAEHKLFIRNVVAKSEEDEKSSGVPKLIINDYSTGEEIVKAGDKFTFQFDVHNTHSNLSANNIKVTLDFSGEDNVFSVTEGSNSFYIKSISPGQTVHNEINLKVKNDSTTKSYPLKISFEYEYEGMELPKDTLSSGLTVSETLSIQVQENARPTVSNITVGSWEPPQMGMPTSLAFDFYNMGNSTLKNVTARVESEDFPPSSDMLFIGNVEAGNGGSHEIEVTPSIEGQEGSGKLIISYEDSNGDTIEVPTEFSQYVDIASSWEDMGDMGNEFDIPEETKKPILEVWLFVVIQIGIFVISIPIVRKIVISIYKVRLRKKEEES